MKTNSRIESLEARIAPALVIGVGGKTATFTDADGDLVKLTISKGTLTAADFDFLDAGKTELAWLKFDGDTDKAGADVSLMATPQKDAMGVLKGDGLVNLGFLNANGLDLGKVTVDGDLGSFRIGDNDPARVGVRSLTVQSIGVQGLSTGAPSLQSSVEGGMGSLLVKGDIRDASLVLYGKVGTVTVGGSIHGGDGILDGSIRFEGGASIGTVLVKGSLIGGSGQEAGEIRSTGPVGSLQVLGHVIGADGVASGKLLLTKVGTLTIGGDIMGGVEDFSGAVIADSIGTLKIGGSIRGGDGEQSGRLVSGSTGSVSIFGDVVGGSHHEAGTIDGGNWGSLKVGGSIRGGAGNESGQIFLSTVGTVKVGGSVLGGDGTQSGRLFSNIAGAVTIGGDIAAGHGTNSGRVAFPTAASVKVGGDLRGGDMDNSGRLGVATAASVLIGGSVIGGAGMLSGELDLSGGVIGTAKVGRDVVGDTGEGSGHVKVNDGTIGSITIGGSLRGGDGKDSGQLALSGGAKVATLKIGRDLIGGAGEDSGSLDIRSGVHGFITVGGSLLGAAGKHSGSIGNDNGLNWQTKALAIGGSVVGGAGDSSGRIFISGVNDLPISFIKIGGDLTGGAGASSGSIYTNNLDVLSFSLRGSLRGGTDDDAGAISTGDIGTLTIGGSIVGPKLTDTVGENLANTALVDVNGHIGLFTLGGSFIAGEDLSPLYDFEGGSTIAAAKGIGMLTIKGSVLGSGTDGLARILAESGPDGGGPAIGQLNIGGGVRFAQILAGYSEVNGVLNPHKADVQIGSVTVGGDWEASSLVAGIAPGLDEEFGFNFLDEVIAGGDPAVFSRIASLLIKGQAFGTASNGADSFGIVAEKFGSVKIGGVSLAIPAPNTFHTLGTTGDFTLGVIAA